VNNWLLLVGSWCKQRNCRLVWALYHISDPLLFVGQKTSGTRFWFAFCAALVQWSPSHLSYSSAPDQFACFYRGWNCLNVHYTLSNIFASFLAVLFLLLKLFNVRNPVIRHGKSFSGLHNHEFPREPFLREWMPLAPPEWTVLHNLNFQFFTLTFCVRW